MGGPSNASRTPMPPPPSPNRAPPTSHQPLGASVPGWTPPPRPAKQPIGGRYCRLEPVEPQLHGPDLFAAQALDRAGAGWTYLPYGPFADLQSYLNWMQSTCLGTDPLFFAIVDQTTDCATGLASFLRIAPEAGSIEIGHLYFSPLLQRSRAATEAIALMLREAFALGYRRVEWKCNALNAASRRAAQRFGFSFEGLFRQAAVVKGRNRDTAWYSVIDAEWPALQAAFDAWLDPDNFAADGTQNRRLSDLTAPLRKQVV